MLDNAAIQVRRRSFPVTFSMVRFALARRRLFLRTSVITVWFWHFAAGEGITRSPIALIERVSGNGVQISVDRREHLRIAIGQSFQALEHRQHEFLAVEKGNCHFVAADQMLAVRQQALQLRCQSIDHEILVDPHQSFVVTDTRHFRYGARWFLFENRRVRQ